MYYLLTAVSLAVSIAMSGIVTEVGTKYLARYVVENEVADFGVDAPADSARQDGDESLQGASGRTSPVIPVLVAGIGPDSFYAEPAPVEMAEVMSDLDPAGLPYGEVQVASIPPGADRPGRQDFAPAAPVPPAGPDPAEAADAADVADAEASVDTSALYDLARDTPHVRDDGTAFLPMATQRIFSVGWQVARSTQMPLADELAGRVVTDPGTGTSIHAEVTGAVRPYAGQFPYVGMRVRKGDPLAVLSPTFAASERAQIEARIQQLTNLVSLTDKQIQRLKDVLFVRYRDNKIEALRVERHGYRRELAALQKSIDQEQILRAPVTGVISEISVNAGGTAQQGQIIFETVDPKALWVEAAAYDLSLMGEIAGASARTSDGQNFDLEFVGGGLVLANQAVPLRFRVVDAPEGLTVGKPVTVIVQKAARVTGIAVPAASVMQDGDGRSIVWERVSAETFRARPVEAVRVAGDTMMVRSGLNDGARIVTEGMTVLNQIR